MGHQGGHLFIHEMYSVTAKATSQAEATLNSESGRSLSHCQVTVCLSEGISQAVSQS